MKSATLAEFTRALAELGKPAGRQLDFLREHAEAPGRARTARQLAQAVRYQSHSGINLQYGLLAKRIGEGLGRQVLGENDARLFLLVEFYQPDAYPPERPCNREWVLKMRPQFAEALKRVGWI